MTQYPQAFSVIIFSVLIQIVFAPIPIGILAICLWYLLKGTDKIVFLIAFYSLLLGVLSNYTVWVVFSITAIVIYIFIIVKSFLPQRKAINMFLIFSVLILWEASLIIISKYNLL